MLDSVSKLAVALDSISKSIAAMLDGAFMKLVAVLDSTSKSIAAMLDSTSNK